MQKAIVSYLVLGGNQGGAIHQGAWAVGKHAQYFRHQVIIKMCVNF